MKSSASTYTPYCVVLGETGEERFLHKIGEIRLDLALLYLKANELSRAESQTKSTISKSDRMRSTASSSRGICDATPDTNVSI
jgi:Tfp pilus assembly protein PilF